LIILIVFGEEYKRTTRDTHISYLNIFRVKLFLSRPSV
jgi:hypothetical protein